MKLLLAFLLSVATCAAQTATVNFKWDPSMSSDVTGYRIYWGVAPRVYTNFVEFGNVTGGQLSGLPVNVTYYFSATALAGQIESDFSNEVTFKPASNVKPGAPGMLGIVSVTITNEPPIPPPVEPPPPVETNAPASEVILDNDSASMSGKWSMATNWVGLYGPYYAFAYPAATNYATYTPQLNAGTYSVYVWYPQRYHLATNAPIDIVSADGVATVSINQQNNGGKWVSIGFARFATGTSGYVRIRTDGASGPVVADAVRFLPIP